MFILDIKEKSQKLRIRKTILVYAILTLVAIAVDKIYAIFGHGVRSDSMTWMFLYPLIGGSLLFLVLELFIPLINRFVGYRVFYNIYNSGIAALIVGSFVKGVLEIAGTNSPFVTLYYIVGWLFIACGLFVLMVLVANHKKLSTWVCQR